MSKVIIIIIIIIMIGLKWTLHASYSAELFPFHRGTYSWSTPSCSLPIPALPPYVVKPLHIHGVTSLLSSLLLPNRLTLWGIYICLYAIWERTNPNSWNLTSYRLSRWGINDRMSNSTSSRRILRQCSSHKLRKDTLQLVGDVINTLWQTEERTNTALSTVRM